MKVTLSFKDIMFIIVIGLCIILLFRACNACNNMTKHSGNDTIKHTIDTVYLSQKQDTLYVPEIVGVTNTVHSTKWIHDTLDRLEVRIEPTDTAKILARYYQTVAYSDTQKVQYGSVVINDTVTQNRIIARGMKTSFLIPTIKETTTILKERNQIWIGANAMSDLKKVYVGAELMLKTKGNIAYSGGVMVDQDGKPLYTGGAKILIRLRKPK